MSDAQPPIARSGDAPWLAGLVVVVALFLAPLLMRWAPACYCDSLVESAPRAMAIARVVQNGGLPLWDFHTFAGARPFYITNESAIYYPLMYPFYLLADLEDAESATATLLLLPYVLHLLWSALGGYAFARIALRLHPAGAFVTGLLYSLSPEMGMQVMTPDVAFLFSWLPWISLAIARFHETGATRWWVAGTVSLALMTSVGTPNFIIRVYFVAAASITLLWIYALVSGGRPRRLAASLVRPAAAISMLAVGAGINGFAWAGVLEGISWLDRELITYDAASDLWSESSMPPLYALAMLVPDFFGVLDTRHGWGITLREGITSLSVLTGGMGIVVAAAGAAVYWLRQPATSEAERLQKAWTLVAVVLLIGSLLTMMGRYTPVFRLLCAIFPWFFRIPHAVYYRFAQCWSMAVLAGVGVSCLIANPAFRARMGNVRVVAACVTAAVVGAALAFLQPVTADPQAPYAFAHLGQFGEWGWFLTRPTLYFVVVSALLLFAFSARVPWMHGRLGTALVVVIVAETLLFARPMFYSALLFEQTRSGADSSVEMQDTRYATLADHPHYRFAAGARDRIDQDGPSLRYTGYNSRVDNQAWALGNHALLGYSSKPLSPRFRTAIERVATGSPYDLMLLARDTDPDVEDMGSEPGAGSVERLAGAAFLRNMNVGYLAGNLDLPPTWVEQTEGLRLYAVATPLPYAYLQERIVTATEGEQLDRLLRGDLREAAYVTAEVQASLRGAKQANHDAAAADAVERFEAMQERHRVVAVDRSRPNSLRIETESKTPAMLVIAETWHQGWTALVDGEAVELRRVNYLQQGLWLDAGPHEVELRFFPPAMRSGVAVSAVSSALLALVAALGWTRRRRW